MQDQNTAVVFDEDRASSYDKQREKMAPIKDALHFFTRVAMAGLSDEAHILCVGVGTGSELFDLAEAYPGWRFTAVEPAAAMLNICRQKAETLGIIDRCSFHEGYLDTLPATALFDGATSILVSHFIVDIDERQKYFTSIAERLKPGGLLLSADLSGDTASEEFDRQFNMWLKMLRLSGVPEADVEKYVASIGNSVAVLPNDKIESLMVAADFETPIHLYQALLINAWCARKA